MPFAKPTMRTELTMAFAKIEATRGVDPMPTAADDAILVGDMDIQLDPTPVERNIFKTSFSSVPNVIGRKVVNVTFTAEIKGSGDPLVRPKLATLLRGCAMRELFVVAGAQTQIEDPVKYGVVNGPKPTFAKVTAPTQRYGSYKLSVVTGGASGVAQVMVSKWAASGRDDTVLPNTRMDARVNHSAGATLTLDETTKTAPVFTVGGAPVTGDQLYAVIGGVAFAYEVTDADAGDVDTIATNLAAIIDADPRIGAAQAAGGLINITYAAGAAPITVTSGTTTIALGDSGAEIQMTFGSDLVVGQEWIVVLYEPGFNYLPTSKAKEVESLTFYVFKDGMLHIVTSCTGAVTFNGESGGLGTAQFEFTGNYIDPVEEPAPVDAVFEETNPPTIELAQMSIKGDLDFCAQSFTIGLQNQTNLKECMNAEDGFDGSQITGREVTASLNPDATYEAYTGMWKSFSKTDTFPIHLRVGTEIGNTVHFYGPRTNFTGLTYGDRNGTVTSECQFQLNGLSSAGDDELRIAFV